MRDHVIENLPGKLIRLFENRTAILSVGVVAVVRALVDETTPVPIDHDPERVAMLLKAVADAQVAELWRIAIPSDRVAP
jgi:hypothetical protein